MDKNDDLSLIALADIDLREARNAVAAALEEGSDLSARRVLTAFRSWVWKALDDRRRDEELRGWFDLYRKVNAALSRDFPIIAAQIQILYELIYESISVSEMRSTDEVMSKKHVVELLRYVKECQGSICERDQAGRDLGLNQSNLTRVLNLATQGGLVEKSMNGRKVLLRLSRAGQERLASLDETSAKNRSSKVGHRRQVRWTVYSAYHTRMQLQQPGLIAEINEFRPFPARGGSSYVHLKDENSNFIETLQSMTIDRPAAGNVSTKSKTRAAMRSRP
jgi:DNA-binding MarR family transcriptional regulator